MSLPALLAADPEIEFNNTVTIWEALAGKPLIPGQPDYLLASILAYQKYLLIQRMNAAFANTLIDYAIAPTLDYLVALLGVTRTPGQPALCTLQFTLVSGHGGVTISAGTRVSSSDGKAVFEVDADTVVASGTDTATAYATCQTDGLIGNGYEAGTVITIMDPQPYISSCENTDITASGSESETDEQLRSRAKLASSTFSVAGPRQAYIYFTKMQNAYICDVAVLTASDDTTIGPGEVDIYPLLTNGGIPSPAHLSEIQTALSADTIRPLTDTVIVSAPTQVDFEINIAIAKLASSPESSSAIVDQVNALMVKYRVAKWSKMGLDIVTSEIEKICSVDGVYDIDVTIIPPIGRTLTGRNLVINANEFAYLQMFYVAITSINNG
jgi:phage-related baseplate assembly protein